MFDIKNKTDVKLYAIFTQHVRLTWRISFCLDEIIKYIMFAINIKWDIVRVNMLFLGVHQFVDRHVPDLLAFKMRVFFLPRLNCEFRTNICK